MRKGSRTNTTSVLINSRDLVVCNSVFGVREYRGRAHGGDETVGSANPPPRRPVVLKYCGHASLGYTLYPLPTVLPPLEPAPARLSHEAVIRMWPSTHRMPKSASKAVLSRMPPPLRLAELLTAL